MKVLCSLIFVQLFICCNLNPTAEGVQESCNSSVIPVGLNLSEVICSEDTIVSSMWKNGVKANKQLELLPNPDISFSSGYSDDFSYTQFQLMFGENKIVFIDTIFEDTRTKIDTRSVYLNNMQLKVCPIKKGIFVLDDIKMHIDYNESEIYVIKNNPSYLLAVSHPMNWVGNMTKFSILQLISLNDKTVVEFITEED